MTAGCTNRKHWPVTNTLSWQYKILFSHFKCLGFVHSAPTSCLLSNICFIISSSIWMHQKPNTFWETFHLACQPRCVRAIFLQLIFLRLPSPLGAQRSVPWVASRFWQTCSSLVNGCLDTPVIFSVPPAQTREPLLWQLCSCGCVSRLAGLKSSRKRGGLRGPSGGPGRGRRLTWASRRYEVHGQRCATHLSLKCGVWFELI